jgi:ABC-type phosphate transport system auxiliary subunit
MKGLLFMLTSFIYCTSVLFSQTPYSADSLLVINKNKKAPAKYIFRSKVENGDTLLYGTLPSVRIYGNRIHKNSKAAQRYARLVRNVKKAYPYAKVAGDLMKKYSVQLDTIKSEKERKKYLNKVEDELKQRYKGELSDLTVTQGIILVKLVDRETSRTSYQIVKELRGGFSAFFWQQLALLFDNNLKNKYDPNGADKEIEEIVDLIEHGDL